VCLGGLGLVVGISVCAHYLGHYQHSNFLCASECDLSTSLVSGSILFCFLVAVLPFHADINAILKDIFFFDKCNP
jgi:hypothetical protein